MLKWRLSFYICEQYFQENLTELLAYGFIEYVTEHIYDNILGMAKHA